MKTKGEQSKAAVQVCRPTSRKRGVLKPHLLDSSGQNECWLKLYRPYRTKGGRAPATLESRRRANMQRIARRCRLPTDNEPPPPLWIPKEALPSPLQPKAQGSPIEDGIATATQEPDHPQIISKLPSSPRRITARPALFPDPECLQIPSNEANLPKTQEGYRRGNPEARASNQNSIIGNSGKPSCIRRRC